MLLSSQKRYNLMSKDLCSEVMHYILFYDFVDNFTEKRAPFRKAHHDHIRSSYQRGELILAGALSEPVDGGVIVFNGSSGAAAEEFARNDPYVINGLIKSWRVRKWNTVIGEGSTPPQ
jgi:hypothetical protein